MNNLSDSDLETVDNIASLLGSIKITHNGTRNHAFTTGVFSGRFHAAFGYRS